MKHCLNIKCNKEIPEVKIDTFGRKNTRTSKFCSDRCRGIYFRKVQQPDYYRRYYANTRAKKAVDKT